MRQSILRAAALAAGLAGAAHAADGDGRYGIDGAGRLKCEAFAKARQAENADYRVFAGWVDGYVTAFNHFQADTFDLTPWQSLELILAKLARYCDDNPGETFVAGLNLLAQALYDERLTAASPVVQARAGTQAVILYEAMLPRIHAALKTRGYKPGGEDGRFTEAMSGALRAFQKAEGLPTSGLPDQPTLNSLFP